MSNDGGADANAVPADKPPSGRWSGVEAAAQAGLLRRKEAPKPVGDLVLTIDDSGTIVDEKSGQRYPDPYASNPCTVAKQASMKCLSDNAYQNSECGEFFDAYNRCKQEWGESKKQYRFLQAKINRGNFFTDLFS